MVYSIQIIGTSVLRQEGEDLPLEKSAELDKLILNMFATVEASEGVGLAAPQIGKSLKLFIIDLSPLGDDEPELKNFRKVFINAKIIEYSGEMIVMNEGCLSLPNLREDVSRHDTVHIQYYDENFEYHDEVLTGFPARVLQHEYDHTYGILFTDRLAKVRKILIKNKLKALANGRFKANYKTVLGDKKRREQLLVRNLT